MTLGTQSIILSVLIQPEGWKYEKGSCTENVIICGHKLQKTTAQQQSEISRVKQV